MTFRILALFAITLSVAALFGLDLTFLIGDGSAVGFAGLLACGPELNFRNLERLPETEADLTEGTHNPAFILALNKQLNEQAGRLEGLFAHIEETNEHPFGYAEILPWRERIAYLKRTGDAKRAAELEKAEALKEAKAADKDEEFQEGYQEFLASEFDLD